MERDYLLRIIEELGTFWRQLIRHQDQHDYATALQLIDNTYGRWFGLSAAFIDLLPDDELIGLVRDEHGQLKPDRCFALARLLTAEGNQYAGLHQFEESYWRYERAVLLDAALLESVGGNIDPSMRPEIVTSAESLAQYTPSSIGAQALFKVYNALGSYRQAEDWLGLWVELREYSATALDRAIAWYTHVADLNDDQLAAGNLPRSDVAAGLAHMQALLHRTSDDASGLTALQS